MAKRYDHPIISETLFQPDMGATLERTNQARPIEIPLPDGSQLGAYWYGPFDRAPVLYLVGGGGETISSLIEHWPDRARRARANMLLLDYPGFATSDGKPSLTACAEAAAAGLEYLLDRPDAEVPAIIVLGRQVGSLLALSAVVSAPPNRKLRGLILETGLADLGEWLADRISWDTAGLDREATLAELDGDYDVRQLLTGLKLPILVLHPTHHMDVPLDHGDRLALWSGAELVLLDRGDRDDVPRLNESEYRAALESFVEHHGKVEDEPQGPSE